MVPRLVKFETEVGGKGYFDGLNILSIFAKNLI